jgi:hypothetical protein
VAVDFSFAVLTKIHPGTEDVSIAINRSGMIWRSLARSNRGNIKLRITRMSGVPEKSASCTVPGPILLREDGNVAVFNLEAGCEILASNDSGGGEVELTVLAMIPQISGF